jgi:hypothetical protein
MPDSLEETDWNLLLRRIQSGKCTPLLGGGAGFEPRPYSDEIAEAWAQEYDYPLGDTNNLAHVAQFLAVNDPMAPKEQIQDWLASRLPPDVSDPDAPYNVLAALPIPIYITTNYDEFLEQALRRVGKHPQQDICRWNKALAAYAPGILESGFSPTVDAPVVFHLYGHAGVPESLVITEDDYLDFLVSIASGQSQLPPLIQRALAGSSLLIMGFHLDDLSFRVLFRGIVAATEPGLRRLSVTAQLPPLADETPEEVLVHVRRYLSKYFQRRDVRVYWGHARSFTSELRQRWERSGFQATIGLRVPELSYRATLRQQLDQYFNLEELRTICFDLGIDFEHLEGVTKVDKARELVVYLERRARVKDLTDLCRRLRPHVEW